MTLEPQPVLPVVVGCPRSGTTLLRAMLDNHPELAVVTDAPRLINVAARLRRGPLDHAALARALGGHHDSQAQQDELQHQLESDPPTTFEDGVRRCLSHIAHTQGKARYGIKTPVFVLHLAEFGRRFPEARFVHIIRDGREVAASMLDHDEFTDDIVTAAATWRRAIARGRKGGARLGPDRYLELRYEELVAAPEPVLHRLCSFLEIPYDPGLLAYPDREASRPMPPRFAHLHTSLTVPPTAGLRDWRRELTEQQVAAFETVAGRTLRRLGYPTGSHREPFGARTRTRLRFTVVQARERSSQLRERVPTMRMRS